MKQCEAREPRQAKYTGNVLRTTYTNATRMVVRYSNILMLSGIYPDHA
jgi:hypothetical protein